MTTVTLHYFALLREQRALSSESLSTSAATAGALYGELAQRHGFTLPVTHVRVAINGEFAAWDTALRTGDELVFIPPVAGG
jgi:molybdopterin converting factor small subunit